MSKGAVQDMPVLWVGNLNPSRICVLKIVFAFGGCNLLMIDASICHVYRCSESKSVPQMRVEKVGIESSFRSVAPSFVASFGICFCFPFGGEATVQRPNSSRQHSVCSFPRIFCVFSSTS
mmetsp:Transcript_24028/g.49943  ORF Transcript_24028/g.49943 Transcript_24028/m.49943 type:complete len:120 (-) Transcript_24028:1559-1918(-)